MKHKIYIFIFALVVMLSFGSFEQVLACSCSRTEICQAYNFADYIFVGKLVSDEKGIYVFDVEEGFIGTQKGEQLKMLSGVGGSCKITFSKNHSYLIFGHKNSEEMRTHPFWKNSFWTTVCNRNSEAGNASEDLKFLRNMSSENIGGEIYGRIYGDKWSEKLDLIKTPFARIPIRIEEVRNNGFVKNLISDNKGEFRLKVPVGTFQITAKFPKGFQPTYSYEPFEVRNFGCVNRDFKLEETKIK